jgi:uncharacterized protein
MSLATLRPRATPFQPRQPLTTDLTARLAAQPWDAIENDLNERGYALIPHLLDDAQCHALAALYDDPASRAAFRSRIVMERYAFGRGEYQYFAYPLPGTVAELRRLLYARLVPLANRWADSLGLATRFPATHEAFIARCHAADQRRPTPLLLQYGPGDYNCLHQDLYGEQIFPLQATILLSAPGTDFSGGEFVLTEQRARRQSRVEVVPLGKGDAVLFAVNQRPLQAPHGTGRAVLRHGVSRIGEGKRHTLGVVFHDAA